LLPIGVRGSALLIDLSAGCSDLVDLSLEILGDGLVLPGSSGIATVGSKSSFSG